MTLLPEDIALATLGTSPIWVKHWPAQPIAAAHCVTDPQSGIEPWQEHLVGLLIPAWEVIAHDRANASLAIGAKAIVSDISRATMVLRKNIGFLFLLILTYFWAMKTQVKLLCCNISNSAFCLRYFFYGEQSRDAV